MKIALLGSTVLLAASLARPLSATQAEPGGRLLWVFGGGFAADDYAYDVACSQDGSCYVTGEFWGVVNKEAEIFVMSLTTAGAMTWFRQAGGTFSDRGISLRVTLPPELLVLRGSGFGSLAFPSPGVPTVSKYLEDELYFTATYSLTGTIQSVSDNLLDEYDLPSRKAEAAHGGVECGWFDFAMPLEAGPLLGAGGRDARLAEFDASGVLAWAVSFGGPGKDWATSVALIPSEAACVVVGSFQASASFPDSILDPDSNPEVVSSAGGADVFVAKFTLKDSDGNGVPDIRQ